MHLLVHVCKAKKSPLHWELPLKSAIIKFHNIINIASCTVSHKKVEEEKGRKYLIDSVQNISIYKKLVFLALILTILLIGCTTDVCSY